MISGGAGSFHKSAGVSKGAVIKSGLPIHAIFLKNDGMANA